MLLQNVSTIILSTTISLTSCYNEKVFYFDEDYTEVAQEYMRNNSYRPKDINDILYDLIRKELEEEEYKTHSH